MAKFTFIEWLYRVNLWDEYNEAGAYRTLEIHQEYHRYLDSYKPRRRGFAHKRPLP